NRAVPGDIWCLEGSRAWFGPEPFDATLQRRLEEGDIHPSGPLWGRGEPPTGDQARALERAVAGEWAALAEGLAAQGLEQARRPLRLLPREMRWHWPDADRLVLEFRLPAGCYATAVLREIVAV